MFFTWWSEWARINDDAYVLFSSPGGGTGAKSAVPDCRVCTAEMTKNRCHNNTGKSSVSPKLQTSLLCVKMRCWIHSNASHLIGIYTHTHTTTISNNNTLSACSMSTSSTSTVSLIRLVHHAGTRLTILRVVVTVTHTESPSRSGSWNFEF